MIDGLQYGPMELDEMVKVGVRPDTYVWCKGMPDWVPASEVPDICRYFRQRLSGTLPSQRIDPAAERERQLAADQEEQERLLSMLPPMAREQVRRSGIRLDKENFPPVEDRRTPKYLPIILYVVSLLMILIGFWLM